MKTYTDPHAAIIIAELLTKLLTFLPLTDAPIIEEAMDYLAVARREHPHEQGIVADERWLEVGE